MYFYSKDEVVTPTRVKITSSMKGVTNYGAQTDDGVTVAKSSNSNIEAVQMDAIDRTHNGPRSPAPDEPRPQFSCSKAFTLLWTHFTTSYSNHVVIIWSIWWALAMAGFLQVLYYITYILHIYYLLALQPGYYIILYNVYSSFVVCFHFRPRAIFNYYGNRSMRKKKTCTMGLLKRP